MTAFQTFGAGAFLEGGRFRLDVKLGEGGMAIVYRAADLARDAEVVVKIPKPGVFDVSSLGRFAKESQTLLKLSHPSIVRVWHVGKHEGWPFIVMDLLTGGDLEACRQAFGGRLSLLNITKWAPAIASALDYIHSNGYVHRDVKPSNILFDGHGKALLSDFGIAKAVQGPEATKLTGTGQLLGTPAYMAPELIMGRPLDGRADQYALAVAIYECLSGRAPFVDATTGAVLVKHVSEAPPPLNEVQPEIPQTIAQVIGQALAKNPQDRFASCTEMMKSLIAHANPTPQAYFPAPKTQAEPEATPKTTIRSHREDTRVHLAKVPVEAHGDQAATTSRRTFPSPKETLRTPMPPRQSRKSVARRTQDVKEDSVSEGSTWKLGVGIGIGAVLAVLLILGVAWRLQGPGEESKANDESQADASPSAAKDETLQIAQVQLLPPERFPVDEGQRLSFAVNADQGESPPTSVVYRLEQTPPEGLELDEITGVLTWQPGEAQGPREYQLTISAADPAGKVLGKETYTIEVREVNEPPVLSLASRVDVNPQKGLKLPLMAHDPDLPTNNLTYSLEGALPKGLVLDPKTGVLTCDPVSAVHLAGAQTVLVRVSDNGTPPRFADKELELNFAGLQIAAIPKQTIPENRTLKLPIKATVLGQSESAFTYRFVGPAPEGGELDAQTGEFTWTSPPDSSGTLATVTIEVVAAANPSLKGTVRFEIEVESLSPTAYWDLPPLPDLKTAPEEVKLLKDPELAQKPVTITLLGFDGFSERVASRRTGDAPEIEAIYHSQPFDIQKGFPEEQALATFAVKGDEILFGWREFRDSEMRKYQHILREAVLEVQVAGGPARYYALKKPKTISALALEAVLTEPYDEKRIGERWDPVPVKTTRNLIFEDVRVELAGGSQTEPEPSDLPSNRRSYPEVAALFGVESFQLAFEEKTDELVWSIETQPNIREAFNVWDSLKRQGISASNNLASARKKLAANSALLNNAEAQIAAGKKGWDQRRATASRSVANAQRDVARYSSQVADLAPKHAEASQAYALLKGPLNRAHSGRVTFSVSRMVAGVKLQVLTVAP